MSSEKEKIQNYFIVVWFSGYQHHEALTVTSKTRRTL